MKIISTNTVCLGYKFVIVSLSNAGYVIAREVAPLEYMSHFPGGFSGCLSLQYSFINWLKLKLELTESLKFVLREINVLLLDGVHFLSSSWTPHEKHLLVFDALFSE